MRACWERLAGLLKRIKLRASHLREWARAEGQERRNEQKAGKPSGEREQKE